MRAHTHTHTHTHMLMHTYTHTHKHTYTHTHTHTHTTDMATPALSRFGSAELKKEFLAPSVAGDMVACLGVSEVGSGSDVASIKTTAVPKKGQLICYKYSKLTSIRN